MLNTKNIAIISLGCDKNRVDTERMLGVLSGGGFVVAPEDKAEIIIINTCAFIGSARKEAIDTILQTAALKTSGALKKLIVTGCLPQKHMSEIKDELPEVDAFLGIGSYDSILQVIESLYDGERVFLDGHTDRTDTEGRRLTTFNYAYLKIADGCDNHCTYCTIPSIRGAYRSRSIDSLVRETEMLVGQGVTELILVAQDVTNYGADRFGKPSLSRLLDALSKTYIKKIRLLYCYPELVDDELIAHIRDNDKIHKYIDIPLQHIDDNVLRLMGRRSSREQIETLIKKLRREIPKIAIRTTFIVGFPGETETEFNNLLQFVNEYKLSNVGIFTFSKEDGTPAAKLAGKVTASVAKRRQRVLAAAQRQVAEENSAAFVGKTLEVLYEGIDYTKGLFYGRSYQSAPDIDPLVYFKAPLAEVGNYYNVKITGVKGYDLIGEVVDR